MTEEELYKMATQLYLQIKSIGEGLEMLLENELTDEELLEHINVFDNWETIVERQQLDMGKRVSYQGVLYEVIQTHPKQSDWTPSTATSIFKKVIPDNIIPIWVIGNAYAEDFKVTHKDEVWVSQIPANTTEPGQDSLDRWWKKE